MPGLAETYILKKHTPFLLREVHAFLLRAIVSPLFACPVGFGLFAMKSAYINESVCADLLAVPILVTVAHILGTMMECLVDHGYLTDHGGSLCVIVVRG